MAAEMNISMLFHQTVGRIRAVTAAIPDGNIETSTWRVREAGNAKLALARSILVK